MVFRVNKQLAKGKYKLCEVVSGLEKSGVLRKLFGRSLARALRNTIVEVNDDDWVMFIDERRKLISISRNHLRNEDERTLYLDFLHELVHIKQLADGRRLFYQPLSYVDWPTEIEAYRYTVQEARSLRMSKKEIEGYLSVPWVTKSELRRLARAVM
ncbi:hypothetical protein HYS54_01395 [Candidatus Micrarchaeota archaeon]|nr:hypothetical protein [Candidatus Micrarchaeota archaeon]